MIVTLSISARSGETEQSAPFRAPVAVAGIIFAIVDWSPERKFIGPFQSVFG